MKYLDEYRDGDVTRNLLDQIAKTVTQPWSLMEVLLSCRRTRFFMEATAARSSSLTRERVRSSA